METLKSILEVLDKKDKEKLLKFAKELYNQKKYKKLREEIENRRKEIYKGEVLNHEEVWKWSSKFSMQKVFIKILKS